MAEDPGRDNRPLDNDEYVYVRVVQYIPTTFSYYLPDREDAVEVVDIVQVDLN